MCAAAIAGAAKAVGRIAESWSKGGYALSKVVPVPRDPEDMLEDVERSVVSPVLRMPQLGLSAVDFILGKPAIRVGRVQVRAHGVTDFGDDDVRSFAANTTDVHRQNLSVTEFERFDALTGASQVHVAIDHCVDACKAGTDLIPLDDLQSTVNRRLNNLTSLNISADLFAKNGFGVAQYLRDWQNNKMISATFDKPRLNFDGGMALGFLGTAMFVVTFPKLSFLLSMILWRSSGMLVRACNQVLMSCKWLWVPP